MTSKWSEQQRESETRKETVRVRENMRREKVAGYFFNMSQLTFAALVLGGIAPILNKEWNTNTITSVIIGIYATYFFAYMANRVLTSK